MESNRPMQRHAARLCTIALVAAAWLLATPAAHAVRIKDICTIEGVRDNHLIGYGLVVGLNGTGDGNQTGFTPHALASFLQRNNIQIDAGDIKVDNVAMVTVEATLPPFATQGMRIDVRVGALGDAENLHGGTLLPTPLRPPTASPNAPGSIYAMAQGPVSTGGFAAGGPGGMAALVKNHPTTAMVPGGALVEQSVPSAFATKPELVLQLRNPDFTTALRIEQIVNNTLGSDLAKARNAANVAIRMPASGENEARVRLIAEIESLQISPDAPARVVYNERTGTIVMGSNVRISKAAITHGNLVFKITQEQQQVLSQTMGKLNWNDTLASSQSEDVQVEEPKARFQVLNEGVTIGEVAEGLNALGVTARDMISIFQALKECGAIQAEIVSM